MDHGSNWTNIKPGDMPMYTVEWNAFACDSNGVIYISGYDNGNVTAVYRSTDNGENWTPFVSGMPVVTNNNDGWPVNVNCGMEVNPRDEKMYIAVGWHGNSAGIYRTREPVQTPKP